LVRLLFELDRPQVIVGDRMKGDISDISCGVLISIPIDSTVGAAENRMHTLSVSVEKYIICNIVVCSLLVITVRTISLIVAGEVR
jgi:tetrahydromethanopterin S-methyltransferase subunit C